MSEFLRRLRWIFSRRRFEQDLDEEIRHHLALKAAAAGSTESAHQQFGNITLLKEESRTMWSFVFWEQLAQDLRYSFRAMLANRLFTAMAVLSLALGIGANTAIYSFMDAIMLRSLPVEEPQNLVILNWQSATKSPEIVHSLSGENWDTPSGGGASPNHPFMAYELLRDKNTVLSHLFGQAGGGRISLLVDGQAELVDGQYVTGGYFSGLGVRPAAGILLGPAEDRAGAPPAAVITHEYWRSRFAGSPGVIGKAIRLNGVAFTVVGVSAPGFHGFAPDMKPSVFLPISAMPLAAPRPDWDARLHNRTYFWIELVGRLKPGVNARQAESQLASIYAGYLETAITDDRERTNLPKLVLEAGGSGSGMMRRQYSKPLWVLMGMVGLILLIACANIANLLLARAAGRRREMAVRLSLGAGRLRVMRQLLTESILLAILGGAAGTGLAVLGIRALQFLLTSGESEFTLTVGLDWRVLSFTLAVALITGILFGLAPALQSVRVDVTPALKETRSSAPRSRSRRFGIPFGLSHVLVVSQIALSLLLVVAAGLFVRTVSNLHSVNLGFNSSNIVMADIDAGKAGYDDAAAKRLYGRLLEQFRSLPGVQKATVTDMPFVSGWGSATGVSIPGVPQPPKGQRGPASSFAAVGPDFFHTMEIPILLGRAIDERDVEGTLRVAVVNEEFAKKYFPGVNPVGRHFGLGSGERKRDLEIVGVARNARYESLKTAVPPVTYVSWQQEKSPGRNHQIFFNLRVAGDPMALANTIRQIVHEAAPQIPVAHLTTQTRVIDSTIRQERTFAQLCSAFGALALIMACVGLYGTMAYAVARRTSEIGIRMALGAMRRRIVWMVLREVLVLAGIGLTIGFVIARESTVVVKSFLFGLQPNDPAALIGGTLILTVCALAAGYAPAWRASRIDPMTALRHE